MIKTLQRKFVVTAMTAVTVLLVLLLGTMNIVNILMVRSETNNTLEILSQSEGDFGRVALPPNSTLPKKLDIGHRDERDIFLSSNFFIVRCTLNGQVLYADVSRTSNVSEEDAAALALEALSGSDSSGRQGKFRYEIISSRFNNETVIVFLDTSAEMLSYLRVLLISGVLGLVCWLLMLLLVKYLSGRAIRPIAENMEKQKQFVTNAGHEIKTPLAIILSNTEAMELYNGENKWSKNIREQTVRLSGLMQKLLTLAKMDENPTETEMNEFCLSTVLNDGLSAFSEPLKLRNIVTETELQPDINVTANREQIEQLISILLENAAKYTSENGTVSVSLQKNERRVKLQIKNSCEKLPEVEPEKLFDRFYREDKARTQKAGGYGIGLSIARSIAEANRAEISAHYELPDTIVFTLTF